MEWDSTLPEDLSRKLTEAGLPKSDQRIRKTVLGFARLDFMKEMLVAVPSLTRCEAGELLEWAHTEPLEAQAQTVASQQNQKQKSAVSPTSGSVVEGGGSTKTSESVGVKSLAQPADQTPTLSRQTKAPPEPHPPPTASHAVPVLSATPHAGSDSVFHPPPLTQPVETRTAMRQPDTVPPAAETVEGVAPPTVTFNTEHCLGGVLRALETDSVCSGLPSPPGTPGTSSKGGGWQIQGRAGRRAVAREEREGAGGGTDALCDSLLSTALQDCPPAIIKVSQQQKISSSVRDVQERRVDWSCGLSGVSQMERQREHTHYICVSMLREGFGPQPDYQGLRLAIKRLLRGLVSVATSTLVDSDATDLFSEPLTPGSAGWMCMKVPVRGCMSQQPGGGRVRLGMGSRGFVPDDIGIEGEQKILSQVEGLRDLLGGDRVYVSSEDWRVLAEEMRKVRPFRDDGNFHENKALSLGLPSMYVRIARGVIFHNFQRTSLSEFDLSKFVPTSRGPRGSFTERAREYFRTNYHEAGPGGRPVILNARKGQGHPGGSGLPPRD
uniref:Uncharacterized protein n=1 Tax=Chromera velia CCMP2878 TaxID=1169474 RepID=A0A0G4G739_9ALVE|eukprot:Cvel_4257.t1-p1 / transcript=Cvel_4257.t1 / gene=Cvel_4257 / organism=Chromera_velia_CCMP2878 / gene_product=hypothetical protein / transcript_product=hypothetical protein / location=Cvel_scaffold184:62692-64341(-) / protein_length=550 / sequence_SO=supercontig / SO=protein_coding / is_pseudo=false